MTRYITRAELNGSIGRLEVKSDQSLLEISNVRTDVQLILQRLDFQKAQCSDCVASMDVLAERVNKLDSWRITGRRLWLGLAGLIALVGGVLGILAAVHVL